MVLVQKWPFFNLFFWGNIGKENVFYDVLEWKNAFLGYKKKSSKRGKIDIFPKGLIHGFGPKMATFQPFLFRQYSKEIVYYDIVQRKNSFLGYKNKKFKKSKNWNFFKGVNSWFWSKNSHFFKLFFLGNIGKQKVLYDILERKNAFLGYKNKKIKTSKNWHLSKGVNPRFWSKNGHFSTFSF